jgi:hypothetical protein
MRGRRRPQNKKPKNPKNKKQTNKQKTKQKNKQKTKKQKTQTRFRVVFTLFEQKEKKKKRKGRLDLFFPQKNARRGDRGDQELR